MSEANEILLPQTDKLLVSSSPHMHTGTSVKNVMYHVVIAMAPACAAGIYFFGLPALMVLLYCGLFSVGLEWLCLKVMGRDTSKCMDGSALITGLLLGMNLAAGTPWWVCLVGSALCIVLAKQLFGGIGQNPFNPALVGRVGLLIAFPKLLTTWPVNLRNAADIESAQALAAKVGGSTELMDLTYATPLAEAKTYFSHANEVIAQGADAVSSATVDPVWAAKQYFNPDYMDSLLGLTGGCIGETSALLLILGGIYMWWRGLIKWQVPVFVLLSVFLFSGLFNLIGPDVGLGVQAPPLYHMLNGGVMLGAFFMATDMVTSPMTKSGAIIFAVGIGFITVMIRIFGNYPEGMSFAILFMNSFVPLIDRMTKKRTFGSLNVDGGHA